MKVVENVNSIRVNELDDGQIAVIVKWPDARFIGQVGQRYKTAFILFGMRSGECYPTICDSKNCKDFLVQVLNPGTRLEI